MMAVMAPALELELELEPAGQRVPRTAGAKETVLGVDKVVGWKSRESG
jgi:hypothetical protein